MRVEFNQVILHNFLSFGDATLNINNDGFIRVSGINENPDDMAASNGSGKSSLWESIVWALTGETIRGTKQVGNIYGTDGTYVRINFRVDNTQYEILRAKDSKEYKTNLLIYVDEVDKSGKGIRESEKLLQQLLPDITASLLGSVIILGQGLPQKFTSNSPSGRKEVLEQLSKSDFMIQDLKDRVAKRKTELSTNLRKHQDDNVAAIAMKQHLEDSIDKTTKNVESMDRTSLEQKHSSLEQEYNELSKIVTELESKLESNTASQQNRNMDLVKLESNKKTEESELQTEYTRVSADLKIKINEIKAPMDVKQHEISHRKNVKDVCPTCGQKLIGVVKLDTTELEVEVKELKQKLEVVQIQLKNQSDMYQSNMKYIEDKYSPLLTQLRNEVSQLTASCSETKLQLRSTQSNKEQVEKQLNQTTNDLQQFDAIKNSLLQMIEDNKRGVEELTSKILYNNCEIEKLQQHLDVQNKFDTALKRDFRGYLLMSVIEYIEHRAKNYCKTIFDTDKIGFELDGNNIDITYCNKPYENLSGGEKQKVDLIVQFSIRDMLCSHLGFTSNILVLDEVFDGLDAIGCQKVLDVISAITDIKNIFIVTHRKDLSIPTDKEIVVVKSCNGISEIR